MCAVSKSSQRRRHRPDLSTPPVILFAHSVLPPREEHYSLGPEETPCCPGFSPISALPPWILLKDTC